LRIHKRRRPDRALLGKAREKSRSAARLSPRDDTRRDCKINAIGEVSGFADLARRLSPTESGLRRTCALAPQRLSSAVAGLAARRS